MDPNPTGLAIDAEGYIAISNANNGCVWIYSPDYTRVKTFSTNVNTSSGHYIYGRGIACDNDGSFWVAYESNVSYRITKYC